MKISTSFFILLTIYMLSAESLECNKEGLCYVNDYYYYYYYFKEDIFTIIICTFHKTRETIGLIEKLNPGMNVWQSANNQR